MATNRVREAALAVLKDYEHGISIVQEGPDTEARLTLRVRGVSGEGAFQELLDAVGCFTDQLPSRLELSGDAVFSTSGAVGERPEPVSIRRLNSAHPMLSLVKTMIDAGINFPGSERFRSALEKF